MNRKPDPYGRDATRPYHIPLKGWWQVAQRVWSESNRDNLSVVAAGCAFFALAAIFPALSALISLYGLTADPATVEQQFRMLGSVLPPQAYDIVIEQIHRIATAPGRNAGLESCGEPGPGSLERQCRNASHDGRSEHRL
jgi:membrane protein